jgi:phytoene dehydrogenase-like protein
MSGLAAGIRLAQAGQRVAVLERHTLWGGLNSWYMHGRRRLDVGLHALTNFARAGERGKPLTRVLRQLRIPHADLRLGEQRESWIVFPNVRLRFANGVELLRDEIGAHFPSERSAFERFLADMAVYPDPTNDESGPGARARLASTFRVPLLVEMLLAPVCWYGSATEDDVPWSTFVVLFKSIFEEGFARPEGGIRRLLDLLRARLLDEGGELHLRSGVARILSSKGSVHGVLLDDGRELQARCVLSSAGWIETMRLCDGEERARAVSASDEGRLSFLESISILDRPLATLGHPATIVFFNTSERFAWRRPNEAVDYASGVLCASDNYLPPGGSSEGMLRLTLLANHACWKNLAEPEYVAKKEEVWREAHARITAFAPDVRPHVVDKDVFTPRTIEHFTGHAGGAVYGSPRKHPDGSTPIEGLHVCGTDQGLLGVVGALLSGITIANRQALSGVRLS